MGPIGWPETVFIFFLALLLFGPKKLPELGRTVGKALSEFQRTKSEMMAAFDRETKQFALDTDYLTAEINRYQVEACSFEPAPDASSHQSSYGLEPYVSHSDHTSAPSSGTAPNQTVQVR